jgi:hypothetical protein
VAVDPGKAYAYTADPMNLPAWAPGFVKSIERRGELWFAKTTLGEARFRFSPANTFGVLDHDVELPSGTFHNPMRVIPNGRGCEILFTLLQLPGKSDEEFQTDLETVRNDLKILQTILEKHFGSTA